MRATPVFHFLAESGQLKGIAVLLCFGVMGTEWWERLLSIRTDDSSLPRGETGVDGQSQACCLIGKFEV